MRRGEFRPHLFDLAPLPYMKHHAAVQSIGVQRGGGEKGDLLPPKFSDNLLRKCILDIYTYSLLQKALKSDLKTRIKRLKIKRFYALGNPGPRG